MGDLRALMISLRLMHIRRTVDELRYRVLFMEALWWLALASRSARMVARTVVKNGRRTAMLRMMGRLSAGGSAP
jgi:hypothetical protein